MFLKIYQSSIALNNNAVSLLERGCYSGAISTLKDSWALMKEARLRRSSSMFDTDALFDDALSTSYLNKAAKLLACHSAGDFGKTSRSRECKYLSVSDDIRSQAEILANPNFFFKSQLFVIRIHHLDNESDAIDENQFDVNFDQDSATILFNYAVVSYICLFDSPTNSFSSERKHSLKKVDILFNTVEEVLQSELEHVMDMYNENSAEEQDFFNMQRFFFLKTLLAKTVSAISAFAGKQQQVKIFNDQAAYFYKEFFEVQQTLPEYFLAILHAPAAAA